MCLLQLDDPMRSASNAPRLTSPVSEADRDLRADGEVY